MAKIRNGRGVVERVTPETAPALIKRVSWELKGEDFVLEGRAEDGTFLSAAVRGGKLTRLTVGDPEGKKSIIEADVPVLELGSDLFEGLLLNREFTIEVKRA
ncbi:hypothetical protein [Thermococcus celericrescens]|uniref:hypothetical protein n=1 Tax=Thermococcus celericrescens TaxID=227598 RepID=UPI000ABA186E